jgi:hypothetical protein
MRTQVMKKARSVILYAALLCGMVFSALTLASNTVYAACDCAAIANQVGAYCSQYGGVVVFQCNETQYQFQCAFTGRRGGFCP